MESQQKERNKAALLLYLILVIPFMIVTANTISKIEVFDIYWVKMLLQALILAFIIKAWLGIVLNHWDFQHYLEFKPKFWQNLGIGILYGLTSAMVVVLTEIITGGSTRAFNQELLGIGLFKVLGLAIIFFIAEAFIEEMVTRGFVLEQIVELGNTPLALLASSSVFVLVQFLWDNPGVSLIGWVNFFVLAFFLGLLYLTTFKKWLCIGFHAAWNLVFTCFFPVGHHHGGHFASYAHMENWLTTVVLVFLLGLTALVFKSRYQVYKEKLAKSQHTANH